VDPQAGRANPNQASSSLAGLCGSCALIAAVLLPFAAVIAWFGYRHAGLLGVEAAVIAFLVCWLSASLALAIAWIGHQINFSALAVFGGMFVRMGLPLGAGLALKKLSPELSEAGVFTMILGMYLVALVVETLLSLRYVPQPPYRKSADSSPNAPSSSALSAPSTSGVQPR
jgi:hypothetical protein